MIRRLRAWVAETHGAGFELWRHFLARFFDSEMVTAQGDWLKAALGPIVVVPSACMMLMLMYQTKYLILPKLPSPRLYQIAVREEQLWLIALTMCITAVLTAIQWQSLFPSRRDLLAVASLPLRTRQIFLAKFGALVIVFAVFAAVLNVPLATVFTSITDGRWHENPSVVVTAFAFAAALIAGCAFVFFSLMGFQGILLNLLPGRLFARVSVYTQAMLFAVSLGALPFVLQQLWMGTLPAHYLQLRQQPRLDWSPPQWFLDLWAALIGARDGSARKALLALALAATLAVVSYLLSYRRYHRLLLEEPLNRTQEARGVGLGKLASWILDGWIRDPREQAMFVFIWKTLARSRIHRLALLACGGIALGWVLSFTGGLPQRSHGGASPLQQFLAVFGPLTAAVWVTVGLRYLFSLPSELRANWIFQITEQEGRVSWLRAVDRFVVWCGIAPVFAATLPVAAVALGWWRALAISALGFMLVLLLFEMLFRRWQKAPFTCSYFPGKRPILFTVLPFFVALVSLVPVSRLFLYISSETSAFLAFLALQIVVCLGLRTLRQKDQAESGLLYVDALEPTTLTLSLGARYAPRWKLRLVRNRSMPRNLCSPSLWPRLAAQGRSAGWTR